MGHQGAIRVFSLNREEGTKRTWTFARLIFFSVIVTSARYTEPEEPISMFHPIGSKPTVCAFAHTPNLIVTGHESGKVSLFDTHTGEEVANNERAHMDVVTDLQLSSDRSYFVTASKDKTARASLSQVPTQYAGLICLSLDTAPRHPHAGGIENVHH